MTRTRVLQVHQMNAEWYQAAAKSKAPDTRSRNRRRLFDTRFRCQFLCADARLPTSSTASGARRQSMTLEVVHRHVKLAPESGVELRPMTPTSGAGFRRLCVRGL